MILLKFVVSNLDGFQTFTVFFVLKTFLGNLSHQLITFLFHISVPQYQHFPLRMSSTAETISPPVSFRTLAYTVSVVFLVVWMISLVAYVLDHVSDKDLVNQGQLHQSMGEVNHLLAMLVTFIMLPITVVLPPLFIRRKIRLRMTLSVNLVSCLVLILYLVTGLVWAILCPTSILLINLLKLATQLVTTIMLLACLSIMSMTTIRKYQGKVPTIMDSAVGTHQGLHHVSHVFLVVGAALLSAMGEGLGTSKASTSTVYTSMLPFFLSTMLLVVQVKHYTRSHVGWYTHSRAMKRVRCYIRQFPLSELEKELVSEKKLTGRLIEGAFTASIYHRPAWSL